MISEGIFAFAGFVSGLKNPVTFIGDWVFAA